VTKELNTLLTALYVLIDDHVVPARAGRGRRPLLSDSELITLAVAQTQLGYHCVRRWTSARWSAVACGISISAEAVRLSQAAQECATVAVQDDSHAGGVLPVLVRRPVDDRRHPIPCGMSRETVKRSDLAGHAGYGYCVSHSRYWRLSLPGLYRGQDGRSCGAWPTRNSGNARWWPRRSSTTTTSSEPAGFASADKGFAGKEFTRLTESMGLTLLRPDRRDKSKPQRQPLAGYDSGSSRYQTLKGQLDLEQHGGRTPAGVFTRVAQRLLALAAGIWHN
jgi:hypothetical protein